jgi:hypothetical protein
VQSRRPFLTSTILLAVAAFMTACPAIRQEESYIRGMQSYVNGCPLMMMDETKQVVTATPETATC